MVFKNENKSKELLVEIIKSDYIELIPSVGIDFDDISIEYDSNYSHITESDDYPLIVEKLKGILSLVNKNPELIDSDVESDLWYRV